MKLRRLSTRDAGFDAALAALTRYEAAQDGKVQESVRRIIADVRARGDAAVLEYTKRFDGIDAKSVAELTLQPSAEGAGAQADALRAAHARIKAFHEKQLQASWEYREADGTRLGQRVAPIERVGLYVPGGKAAYPSSVLMNAIPAKVAGVREIVMVSPKPSPLVLAAAAIAGVDRVIGIGGAQAVAALAYGTGSIPRVDKIVGPGSAYVAVAKAQVARDCAIDFFAGPSEIVIVAVEGDPDWIAADLIAQAEHDTDARALLLTPRARLARAVAKAVTRQMPADGPAAEALRRNGGIILTRTLAEAAALANRIAPEHLVVDSEATARLITVAGAVFIGPFTAQAAGDYAIGSNHVLPTSGAARFRGGLHASDFVRITSVQRLTAQGLARVGPTAVTLAHAEGLTAHAASVQMRLDALGVPGRRAAAAAAAATRRRGRT